MSCYWYFRVTAWIGQDNYNRVKEYKSGRYTEFSSMYQVYQNFDPDQCFSPHHKIKMERIIYVLNGKKHANSIEYNCLVYGNEWPEQQIGISEKEFDALIAKNN